MDELPDELLLHILRLIGDGRTLLDGVSLVCKRWRSVVADPRGWADVRVRYPPCRGAHLQDHNNYFYTCAPRDHDLLKDSLRIVQRAPALGGVVMDSEAWEARLCEEGYKMLLTSLLRTDVKVRSLTGLRGSTSYRGVSLALVQSLAPHLEELGIGAHSRNDWPHGLASVDFPALRKLDLCCIDDGGSFNLPLGLEELALSKPTLQQLLDVQRMPRLRRLVVDQCPFSLKFPPPPPNHCGLRQLRVGDWRVDSDVLSLWSLVGAHAATLQHLEVVYRGVDGDDVAWYSLLTMTFPELKTLVLMRMEHGGPECCITRRGVRQHIRAPRGAWTRILCSSCNVNASLRLTRKRLSFFAV